MNNETRALFNLYLDRQAELNAFGADDIRRGVQFTIEPSIQQKLETRQQESIDFLNQINIVPVPEMAGEKLGLGISGPIASRTNTNTTDRSPKDPSTLDQRGYQLKQTNSDTFLSYAKLDLWAKFPDFQVRIRNEIITRQGLDRIMIGWNGTSAAATTDLNANPSLQDVNKGWLQYLREVAPTHVFDEGSVANKVRVGQGGDYVTIDGLVFDAKNTILPTWARNDTSLVAIVGSDLLHDKYFPMVDTEFDPTEQIARTVIMSKKQVGGLAAAVVPYFPADKILITPLKNLSLYYQDGKRRRTIVDNAKRDRIENYESSNDGYVVEDTDFALLIENIKLDPATW